MTITVDQVSNSSATASVLSFSHSLSVGSNRCVVLAVSSRGGTGRSLPSATYNGVAMNLAATSLASPAGGEVRSTLFVLFNSSLPVSGTSTVSISTSGGGAFQIVAGCIGLFNVAQSGVDATGSAQNSAGGVSSLSAPLATATADAWILGAVAADVGTSTVTWSSSGGTFPTSRWSTLAAPLNGSCSTTPVQLPQNFTVAAGYPSNFNSAALSLLALAPVAGSFSPSSIVVSDNQPFIIGSNFNVVFSL